LLIPALMILIILTGWLQMQGESVGFYSTEFGLALFSLINIVVVVVLVFLVNTRLATLEKRRRLTDLRIRELNAGLEQQVEERTADLRESEEKYRLLAENVDDVVWTAGADMRFTYLSPSIFKLRGFTPEEVCRQELDQVLTPESVQRIMHELELAAEDLAKGRAASLTVEAEQYCKDGSTVWTESLIRPLYDSSRKHTGYAGVTRDISKRRQAEQELKETEARYRELFDNMASGVAVYEATPDGEDFIIRDFNRSAEIMEKVRKEDILGRSVLEVFPGVVKFGLLDVFRRVWLTGTSESCTTSLYKDSRTASWRENYVYKLPSGEIVAIYDDVTEQRKAEEKLAVSEAKYRSLVETGGAGIATIDLNGTITFVNKVICEALGYSDDNLIGRNFTDFLHQDDSPKVMEIFMSGISDPDYKPKLEFRLLHRDGHSIWFYTAPTLATVAGEVTGASAILVDVTERKKAEEELAQSEEKFRNVFDYSSVGKSITAINGVANVNPAFAIMLGYTLEELAGRTWQDLTFPEDIELTRKCLGQLQSGEKKSVRFIKRYLKKDGSLIWADVNTVLQRDGEGNPLYYITAAIDITDRKKSEEDLQNYALFLNNMVNQSPTPIWISDEKGTLIRINRACCELLHLNEEDLVGKYNVFHDPMIEEQGYMPLVRNVFEKGEVARFEIYMDYSRLMGLPPDKDTTLTLHAIMFPIMDTGGNITNAAVHVIDLTARKKAELQIQEKTRELERSNTELERFAYVASHDLQEPLRTISSYIQLIERRYRDKLDEQGLRYMDFTVTAANRLQSMIDGMLEYSRVETRGQPFEPVDCEEVLRQTTDNLRSAIQESGTEITHDPLPSISGDRPQLVRLFQNLLANSIKYRDQRPPVIQVSARKKDREWIFSIKDNGMGINPEYKEQIFIIFQRLHGRDVPGIGLGLSVAKRIVERHGGRIWVESEPGQGATFYFTIPVDGGKQK
ncbi:MAG: PAS domain S-box protein, partial [Dehalococcoidia bacterium]|nr:PAS domain S-box protein [Dehalococcoidia bacterium]